MYKCYVYILLILIEVGCDLEILLHYGFFQHFG